MSAVGVVSDTGTYDDQAYYDIREVARARAGCYFGMDRRRTRQSRRGYNDAVRLFRSFTEAIP